MPIDANNQNQTPNTEQELPPALDSYLDYFSEQMVICKVSIDETWTGGELDPPFSATRSLNFAFLELEDGITESSSPEWNDTSVIGRAEAYKSYMGGSNKEIPLTFRFRAQMGTPDDANAQALEGVGPIPEVMFPVRWLEALKNPVTRNGLSHAPPPLILTIGDLLVARCVMQNCEVTWEAPFEPVTMHPHGASVQCTFSVVRRGSRGTLPSADLAGMNDNRTIHG